MSLMSVLIVGFLFFGAWLSYRYQKLTKYGALTAALVGAVVYLGTGYLGITLLSVFFVLGTGATSWSKSHRAALLNNDKDNSARTAGQVLANGGTAAILAVTGLLVPEHQSLLQLMLAGSLASASADTLSSELGTLYGKHFINVLTLRKDERGLDGVISLEGTLIGLIGAAVIAVVYGCFLGCSVAVFYIFMAGMIGNLADSILGATLERKGFIGNDIINFLNTITGAVICSLAMML